MSKATKLPSGNYRVQFSVDGRRYSVTADSARKAQALAAEQEEKLRIGLSENHLTFSKAAERYIQSKSNILSPSTIRGYTVITRTALSPLSDRMMHKITALELQNLINENAAAYSPKSIKNQIGFLSAVFSQCGLPLPKLSVPPPQKKLREIPDPDRVALILSAAKEKDIRLYTFLLFVATLGLSPSEILALKKEDIKKDRVYIHSALVYADGGEKIYKETTKAFNRTRTMDIPSVLLDALKEMPQSPSCPFAFDLTYSAFTAMFRRLLKKNNLPHCRIYDLRHAYASTMLMLGVPDKYAMERMGHATSNMLKTVYQHTYSEKQKQTSELLDRFFENLLQEKEK